jgi:UBX domain-containing protein 1
MYKYLYDKRLIKILSKLGHTKKQNPVLCYFQCMNNKCSLSQQQEPERSQASFQGVGRTLGSSSNSVAPEPNVSSATPLTSAPPPSAGLVVDQSLPSTSIQLRLADGTRLISHFNHHHTVGDIRAFIDSSRPGGRQSYQLQMMGFPPKVLADETQTIEQAGLANSVVIQKF